MNQDFVAIPIVKRTIIKDNAFGIQSGPKRVVMKEKTNKTPKQDKSSGNYMKSTEAYRNSVFLGTQKHQSTVEHNHKQIVGQFTHQSPDSIAMPSTPILNYPHSNIDNQPLSTKKTNFVQVKWKPAASPDVNPRTPTKAVRSDVVNKMMSLYSNGYKSKNKQLTRTREKIDDLCTKKTTPIVSPPIRDKQIFQNSQLYAHKKLLSSTVTPRRIINSQTHSQYSNEKITTPSTRLDLLFESPASHGLRRHSTGTEDVAPAAAAQVLPSPNTILQQFTTFREKQGTKDDIKAHLRGINELKQSDHGAAKRSSSVPPRHTSSTVTTTTTLHKYHRKNQQSKKSDKKNANKKSVITSTTRAAEKPTVSHLQHTVSSTIRSHSPLPASSTATAASTATPARTPRSPSSHYFTPSRSNAASTATTITTATTTGRYSTPRSNTAAGNDSNNRNDKCQANLFQCNLFASNKLGSPADAPATSTSNLRWTALNSSSLMSPSLSLTDEDEAVTEGLTGNQHRDQQHRLPQRPLNHNSISQQPPSDTRTSLWGNELGVSGEVALGAGEDPDQDQGLLSTFSASSISFSASLSSQSSAQMLFTKMRTTSFPVFPPPPPPSTTSSTMTSLPSDVTAENNHRKGDCDMRRDEDISFGSEESSVDREGTDTISFIDCTFDSLPSGQLEDTEGGSLKITAPAPPFSSSSLPPSVSGVTAVAVSQLSLTQLKGISGLSVAEDLRTHSSRLSTFDSSADNFTAADDSDSESDSVHTSELDTAFITSMSRSASSCSLHSTSHSSLLHPQDRSTGSSRLPLALPATRRSLSLFSASSSVGSMGPGDWSAGSATLQRQHISGISLSSRDVHRLPSGESGHASYDTSVNTLTHPLNTAICLESASTSYDYDAEWMADLDLVASIPIPATAAGNPGADASNLDQSSWSEDSNLSDEAAEMNRQVKYRNIGPLEGFGELRFPVRGATAEAVTAASRKSSAVGMSGGNHIEKSNDVLYSNRSSSINDDSINYDIINDDSSTKSLLIDLASSKMHSNHQHRAVSPPPFSPSSSLSDDVAVNRDRDLEDPVAKLLHSDFSSMEQYYFEPLKIPFTSLSDSSLK